MGKGCGGDAEAEIKWSGYRWQKTARTAQLYVETGPPITWVGDTWFGWVEISLEG